MNDDNPTVQHDKFLLGKYGARGLHFDHDALGTLFAAGFPVLLEPSDLANALLISTSKLQWLCYDDGITSPHYRYFSIPKKKGGFRQIAAPKPLLKMAQHWIRDNILIRMVPHRRVAFAYRKGISIVHNARLHAGKKIVVRIDIKDFFPSITYRRIKGLFEGVGYNEGMASIFSYLCTEPLGLDTARNGSRKLLRTMPQGACTSPDIANLICRKLDYRIEALSEALGFSYSRYADDLVFSHDQQRGRVDVLISQVYSILTDEGFRPNEDKTRVMRVGNRQIVTGLVVNDVPKISRRDFRRFRAIAHQCTTKGYESVSEKLGRDAKQFLLGYLAFARMVNNSQVRSMLRCCPVDIQNCMDVAEDVAANSVGMQFVQIVSGTLDNFTTTATQAKLTSNFILGKHPVTISQFQSVMGYNPMSAKSETRKSSTSNRPATRISWMEAVEFCRRLSKLPEEQKLGRKYRLPTEAEWEYACRAGNGLGDCFGPCESQLGDYAWYQANAGDRSHPVGLKKPNAWGVYDMHGNVWEWCEDWYGNYQLPSLQDPRGPLLGAYRVLRGGSYRFPAQQCLANTRNGAVPTHKDKDIGFRVVMVLNEKK